MATTTAPKKWSDMVRTAPPAVVQHPKDVTPVAATETKQQQPLNTQQKVQPIKKKNADEEFMAGSATFAYATLAPYDAMKAVSIQPRGLFNVQNCCYVNCIVQSLLFIPPFYNVMCALHLQKLDKQKYPLTKKMIRFVKEFAVHGNQTEPGTGFTPTYLLDHIKQAKHAVLLLGEQQDAHEFLQYLLSTLHEELKTKVEQQLGEDTEDSTDGWEEVGKNNRANTKQEIKQDKSPINDLFCGKMRSLFKKSHSKGSVTVQPFYTVHLDIEVHGTIKQALHSMSSKEKLQDVHASKHYTLEQVPSVLILQLKRFTYNATYTSLIKLEQVVQYEATLVLDKKMLATSKMSETDPRRNYELYAVVMHHGTSIKHGHYTAFVRHGSQKWLHIDDNKISVVPLATVLNQAAYLLIYVQKSK